LILNHAHPAAVGPSASAGPPAGVTGARAALDPARLREDFPALSGNGAATVYLDSASTTQKPHAVLEAMTAHYTTAHANVHRGSYALANGATRDYEATRDAVAEFVNAWDRSGVVFTHGFTEAANLVAYAWARNNLGPGDEILSSELEHHSNLLPWQQAARETGATIRYLRATPDGALNTDDLDRLVTPRTRLVAVTAMSNVTGAFVDLARVRRAADRVGALLFVDGAQLTPHTPVDVQKIGADFFGFSGHKLLGPTGIGALVARPELLEEMEPFQTGGSMIREVTLTSATWSDPPWRFEAGTPPIAEAAGLRAALRYLNGCRMSRVRDHERRLTRHGLSGLSQVAGVTLYGPRSAQRQSAIFAFNLHDTAGQPIHPQDVSTLLDRDGLAIRTGHHCAQPLLRRLGVAHCCRASAYLYNTPADLDRLALGLEKARSFLSGS
jgi:cysteine desulfurase / selenocysteine lyase